MAQLIPITDQYLIGPGLITDRNGPITDGIDFWGQFSLKSLAKYVLL